MRRQKVHSGINTPPNSTLGNHFHIAVNKIEELRNKTVALMCHPDFTAEDAFLALFPLHVIAAMKEGRKYTAPHTNWADYELPVDNMAIQLNFSKLKYLPPLEDTFNDYKPDIGLIEPMERLAINISQIHQKFAVVTYVLRWLDEHCTLGAIRYHWPTIMSLAKDHPGLTGELPRRFDPPAQPISPLLPLLRESGTTIATALVMPEVTVDINFDRPYDILVRASTFRREGYDQDIPQGSQTYNFKSK